MVCFAKPEKIRSKKLVFIKKKNFSFFNKKISQTRVLKNM